MFSLGIHPFCCLFSVWVSTLEFDINVLLFIRTLKFSFSNISTSYSYSVPLSSVYFLFSVRGRPGCQAVSCAIKKEGTGSISVLHGKFGVNFLFSDASFQSCLFLGLELFEMPIPRPQCLLAWITMGTLGLYLYLDFLTWRPHLKLYFVFKVPCIFSIVGRASGASSIYSPPLIPSYLFEGGFFISIWAGR